MANIEKNKEDDIALDDIRDVIQGESLDKVNMETFSLTDVFSSEDSENDEKSINNEKNDVQDADDKGLNEKQKTEGADLIIGKYLAKIVRSEVKKWLDNNMLDIVKARVDEEIKKLVNK